MKYRNKTILLPTTIVIFALLCVSCCCPTVPHVQSVAVPEEVYRNETSLPLTESSRSQLVQFLQAGGRTNATETVFPDVQQKYGALLQILSEQPQAMADLRKNAAFHALFPSPPVYAVIDARNKTRPQDDGPLAFTDTRFWWVLHPQEDLLKKLTVFRNTGIKGE